VSVQIQTHTVDEDCRTCARCGIEIPNIKINYLAIPHRPGEVVGLVTTSQTNPVAYRPNPSRYNEDQCQAE